MRFVDKLPERPSAEDRKIGRTLIFKLKYEGEIIFQSQFINDCRKERMKLKGNRQTMPIQHEWQ